MGKCNIVFGVAVTLAVSVGFVVPGTPASANAPSGTPIAAASTTTPTGIDCLTGVWDYTSFVGPIGAIDLAFTGVSAEFGPGYFSVSGADGTATGTITGFEDPGTVITTSLVEAGAMSAQEDGTIRLWNVSSDSNVSIVGSYDYPTVSAALVPDTPLVPTCDGDAMTLTTRSGGMLTFSRRSDAPSPPAQLPAIPDRDPALDCLEGRWAVVNLANAAVEGVETSIDYTGMALTVADGLLYFDLGVALAGTLDGAAITADLSGGTGGFYSTADGALIVDLVIGEGGGPRNIMLNGTPVDQSEPVDLPDILPVLDSATVACDGDAAALTLYDGSVLSLQRIAQPGAQFAFPYEDYFEVPQLGSEPVEGTGCGGDGSIGETIPDGLWRGLITSFDGPTAGQSTSLEFDLVCVYVGDVAQQLYDEFTAENPDYASPPWDGSHFTVNNNPRTRTVPLAPGFTLRAAEWQPDGPPASDGSQAMSCVVPSSSAPLDDPQLDSFNDEWLQIENGAAVWAVASCPHD